MARHVLFQTGIRRLGSKEKGFFYRYPDSGETVRREKVLATMVRLMNAAHFRVGEERYAKKNKTYGIATLRRKHLKIEGDTMIFEYTGKWGKFQRQCVTDPQLRQIVEECAALPGYEVFKYYDEEGELKDVKSRELNAYVKE